MNTMNPVAYGAIVAVIGIAVVFVGLTILVFCVWLMGQLFRAITKSKEEKAQQAAQAAAPAPAPAPAPVQEQSPAEEVVDDAELIAVIAAAIAAFDDSGKRLVVRKVRRVPGWKSAARGEQIYHF